MPRLLRTVARTAVISGTATAVSGRVARRQNNRWAAKEEEQYQQQAAQAPPAPAAAAPVGEDSMIDQLKQLGEPATRASSPTTSSPPRRPSSSAEQHRPRARRSAGRDRRVPSPQDKMSWGEGNLSGPGGADAGAGVHRDAVDQADAR